jgi:membrane associated rhomboid family serine protease
MIGQMSTVLLVAAAAFASGLSTWAIERRRTSDRALRVGIGAALTILCILAFGFVGERVAPAEWRNAGFAAGIFGGALLAVVLTRAFDLRTRPRRAN